MFSTNREIFQAKRLPIPMAVVTVLSAWAYPTAIMITTTTTIGIDIGAQHR
jgi:hypothetical protein